MVHVQGCTTWPTMQAHAYTGVGNKPLLPVWLYKELHLVPGAEAGVEGGDGLAACRLPWRQKGFQCWTGHQENKAWFKPFYAQ